MCSNLPYNYGLEQAANTCVAEVKCECWYWHSEEQSQLEVRHGAAGRTDARPAPATHPAPTTPLPLAAQNQLLVG